MCENSTSASSRTGPCRSRCWARRSTVGSRRHDKSAAPLYPSPPRRAIFSSMPDAADLTDQLADEDRAKQRRYVLANTRARWRFVALGAVLLAILRVAKVAPVSWPFILGFAGVFAAVSYAMLRMARGGEFRGWHPLADMAVSAAMISAVLYAVGPTGHLLYVVYLIAPLQAALYLGQTEAWQALLVNLTGFGLATAVRVSQGTPGWAWSAFAGETLVLALVSAALVPTLARFVTRLQAARSTLAQVERGDLTVQLQDEELDELGYLGASVNRTTGAIAGVVRQVQHQSQDLAAMAQQLAASAQELQAASQEISAAAERLTEGTSRQRQLIGHGRDDSEAAADVAAQLHAWAQEAERQIAGVAQQAQRHGQEIAAMDEGRRTAQGVGAVSAAARQALDAIFGDLNATVKFASAFAGETAGQTQRIREVVRRMEEVAGIAETAAQGAEQTSAATEQQIASLGELTTTSQHLSVAAAKLTETMQRFNVNGLATARGR